MQPRLAIDTCCCLQRPRRIAWMRTGSCGGAAFSPNECWPRGSLVPTFPSRTWRRRPSVQGCWGRLEAEGLEAGLDGGRIERLDERLVECGDHARWGRGGDDEPLPCVGLEALRTLLCKSRDLFEA